MAQRINRILDTYHQLLDHYGAQQWWPADSAEEVMIGAVLTQNTNWGNVKKAIANLRQARVLDLKRISDMECGQLAQIIRPSGYFNIKARRLQSLCRWVLQQGGVKALTGWPTAKLRVALLEVYGIGPETADDIILYAFERPVFVIDAYTRRLMSRLGVTQEQNYGTLQDLFESNLEADASLYSEYHALIVLHAKQACRAKPVCNVCVLRRGCGYISES